MSDSWRFSPGLTSGAKNEKRSLSLFDFFRPFFVCRSSSSPAVSFHTGLIWLPARCLWPSVNVQRQTPRRAKTDARSRRHWSLIPDLTAGSLERTRPGVSSALIHSGSSQECSSTHTHTHACVRARARSLAPTHTTGLGLRERPCWSWHRSH